MFAYFTGHIVILSSCSISFYCFQSALEEVYKLYPAFFKYLIDWKRRKSKQLQHNISNVTFDKGSFYISSGDHELSIDPHVSIAVFK